MRDRGDRGVEGRSEDGGLDERSNVDDEMKSKMGEKEGYEGEGRL